MPELKGRKYCFGRICGVYPDKGNRIAFCPMDENGEHKEHYNKAKDALTKYSTIGHADDVIPAKCSRFYGTYYYEGHPDFERIEAKECEIDERNAKRGAR